MHERATKFQSVTGVLIPVIQTNSWLLYGGVFALGTFLVFIPFLRRLDRRTAVLFLLSGGVFLSGALGFEFVQAFLAYQDLATGQEHADRLYMILEEGGEMYGIALFNCTLFARIVSHRITLAVRAGPDQPAAP